MGNRVGLTSPPSLYGERRNPHGRPQGFLLH